MAEPNSKAILWNKAQHEGALPPPCIVRKDVMAGGMMENPTGHKEPQGSSPFLTPIAGSLKSWVRTMHGGGSAPSCCALFHRIAFVLGSAIGFLSRADQEIVPEHIYPPPNSSPN